MKELAEMAREKERDKDLERYFGVGTRRKVLKRDKGICQICGITRKEHFAKYGKDIAIDHIKGKRAGNSLKNLRVLCMVCNLIYAFPRFREYKNLTKTHGNNKTLVRCDVPLEQGSE